MDECMFEINTVDSQRLEGQREQNKVWHLKKFYTNNAQPASAEYIIRELLKWENITYTNVRVPNTFRVYISQVIIYLNPIRPSHWMTT